MTLEKDPFVSIVVPAYNEERYIGACIESLLELDYERDNFEIIIVDNGSSDATVDIASTYDVKVIIREDVNVGEVRNLGVKESKGEVIAFVDSDCLVPEKWLRAALEKLSSDRVGAVGGGCRIRANASWVEKAWVISEESSSGKTNILAGSSFIVKRDVFDECNGFDSQIRAGEDTKLSKMISDKYDVWALSACEVVHLGYPRTQIEFLRRQYWHSTSLIKSNYGIFHDRTFLMINLFLVSLISLFVYLLTGLMLFGLLSVFLVVCPILFSIKRIHKSKGWRALTVNLLVSILILDLLYFIGRTSGYVAGIFCEPFQKK